MTLLFLIIGLFIFLSPTFASESVYYIHSDHLGSTNLITDSSGNIVGRQVYYPYGGTRQKALGNSFDPPRQYTGQVSDQDETGLYYYNARYYSPKIAKFTQADNSLQDGLNRYIYTLNNPINNNDPSGMFVPCPWCQTMYEDKQNQGYPDEAKKPENLGQRLAKGTARIMSIFGLLDLTPRKWGLKEYVSRTEAMEDEINNNLISVVQPIHVSGSLLNWRAKIGEKIIQKLKSTVDSTQLTQVIKSSMEKEALYCVTHECGHALVASQVDGLTIEAMQFQPGVVVGKPLNIDDIVVPGAKGGGLVITENISSVSRLDYASVFAAGPVAEARVFGKPIDSDFLAGKTSDAIRIRELGVDLDTAIVRSEKLIKSAGGYPKIQHAAKKIFDTMQTTGQSKFPWRQISHLFMR